MTDQLITFETAKLAKEKGFNIEVHDYWDYLLKKPLSEDRKNNYNDYPWQYVYSAPTQSLLQKWLRETKKIVVTIEYSYAYNLYNCTVGEVGPCIIDSAIHDFKIYEDALERGLQEGLKLIK